MHILLNELRRNPLLWLLVFVPVVFVAEHLKPQAHTLLFVLSVLAIVPLSALRQQRRNRVPDDALRSQRVGSALHCSKRHGRSSALGHAAHQIEDPINDPPRQVASQCANEHRPNVLVPRLCNAQ
jgi:hypothetical protein